MPLYVRATKLLLNLLRPPLITRVKAPFWKKWITQPPFVVVKAPLVIVVVNAVKVEGYIAEAQPQARVNAQLGRLHEHHQPHHPIATTVVMEQMALVV